MKLYIDECGDLGFSSKATRFFIVSFFMTYNEWEPNIKLSRLLKQLRQRKKYRHDELKFSKASHVVRISILEQICETDRDFGFVVLNKNKVHNHLRGDPNLLYRFVVIDPIMEMVLPYVSEREKLIVTVDRSLPEGKLRHEFNSYVELKGYYYSRVSDRQVPLYKHQIETRHVDSQREPCLQAADCLAGAEFQRFERKVYDYHNVIEPKIKSNLFRFLW
jgi:hypothetical protein